MTNAQDVSDFVNESWSGIYITRRWGMSPALSGYPDGTEIWETLLHGPTGPKVFTLEHPDGRLEDVTRESRG